MTGKRVKGTSAPRSAQQVAMESEEVPPVGISEDDSGAEAFAINTGIDTTDLIFSSGVDLNNNKVSEPRD